VPPRCTTPTREGELTRAAYKLRRDSRVRANVTWFPAAGSIVRRQKQPCPSFADLAGLTNLRSEAVESLP
jgi:hypothetical protein